MADCIIAFNHTGRCLVGPSFAENVSGAHILKVLDRDMRELAATTFEQVETDPEGEMTRLLDALTGGRVSSEDIDPEWGRPETVLTVSGSGLQLRCDRAADGPVTYLRVLDTDGEEFAYWVSDEWQEDPELVLGALLGALQGGPLDR